jgi:hypothetical protein
MTNINEHVQYMVHEAMNEAAADACIEEADTVYIAIDSLTTLKESLIDSMYAEDKMETV